VRARLSGRKRERVGVYLGRDGRREGGREAEGQIVRAREKE
jgi:hypothetical protein